MFSKRILSLFFVVFVSVSAQAGMTYQGDVEYSAGTGANEASIVIDFDFENYFVFTYRWDGAATGWDALEAIEGAGALNVEAKWYEEFQSHFVSDFSYLGGVEYDYGEEAIVGWGYWGSSDGESWLVNPGVDGRLLSDGSWDGWVWSNYDFDISWDPLRAPGEAAIPEPGMFALFGTGLLILRKIKR